jgi:hypothetical protein
MSDFDHDGVAKHIRNPVLIEVFRECVTGQGITPYLGVDQQAELARQIVDDHAALNRQRAKRYEDIFPLTALNIKAAVRDWLSAATQLPRGPIDSDKERRQRLARKLQIHITAMRVGVGNVERAAAEIDRILRKEDVHDISTTPIYAQLHDHVELAKQSVDALHERLSGGDFVAVDRPQPSRRS